MYMEGKIHIYTHMYAQHQFFLAFLNMKSIIFFYSGQMVSGRVNMLPLYRGKISTSLLLFHGCVCCCVKAREEGTCT